MVPTLVRGIAGGEGEGAERADGTHGTPTVFRRHARVKKMKHCPGCDKDKQRSEYHRDKGRPDGIAGVCKSCYSERVKSRYHDRLLSWWRENKGAHKKCTVCGEDSGGKNGLCQRCKGENNKVSITSKKTEVQNAVVLYKNHLRSSGCCICGYNKYIGALDFHHLFKRKSKEFARIRKISDIRKEIEDHPVVVVCSNCHREIHCGMVDENSLVQYRISVSNNQRKLFSMRQYSKKII
jgi:hypothetical protein